MKLFTQLYMDLDGSNRTTIKLQILRNYFRTAPPEDAAWAVFFLSGNRLKRSVKLKDFRLWAGDVCAYPEWMIEECYDHVGDLAETLALLLAHTNDSGLSQASDIALHTLIETVIQPLRDQDEDRQKASLHNVWQRLDGPSCFVFNKLITGGFRVGVSQTLVHRALAEVAAVEPAVMAHRLMGDWQPTGAAYTRLFSDTSESDDPARPYPFCLAHPLEYSEMADELMTELGAVSDWQVEWKWDGIRAQMIKRAGEVILWSRGEAIVSDQFPEICEAFAHCPDGTVLDGEILVWQEESRLPDSFAALQRRLGRKQIGAKLKEEVPVVFMAYDLLEVDGVDWRARSTAERRSVLEMFHANLQNARCRLSPLVSVDDWTQLAALRQESRKRRVEGFMLKGQQSAYTAGRKKGEWWKWKVDPYTVDAVLVYAQQGHGRRAGLYTDYTFSIWDKETLVPFAKAYSGLTDAEIRKVDRWIRAHTREKHGPVRVVDPELVFEIAFEGISESKRHKSGIAVRFPRIHRWRKDKPASEADRLDLVRDLLAL